jgi:hypothetical protein
VTGENLSAEQIVNELEWIIPCNNQWDLRPTDDGAFKVPFPSKVDLARMRKIINVPGITMFLHFERTGQPRMLISFILLRCGSRFMVCAIKTGVIITPFLE